MVRKWYNIRVMNKDTDGEGEGRKRMECTEKRKKIFRRNESAPVAYLSGGGGGTTRCGLRPFSERRQLQKKWNRKRMAKPPPVQMGTRVFDPTMTPPREVGATSYKCTELH